MTVPVIIRRVLSVHFARSITTTNQVPETVEVVVIPLSEPSAPTADATFIGGQQRQTILLDDEDNVAEFSLVPTDSPELTERVLYRVAWRKGVVGRTFTYDFAMPDADIDFDDLSDLGAIIGGEIYLQQTDLGVAGRVARLNNLGQVVDAEGVPVAGQADVSGVQGALNIEIVNRQSADVRVRSDLSTEIRNQTQATLTTAQTYIQNAVIPLQNADTAEANARRAADTTLTNDVASLTTSLTSLTDTVGGHTTTLGVKADLVNGKVPIGQIPDSARTQGVQVANQAEMLALTLAEVQQFDFCLRPDGVFALFGTDPANLSHWIKLNRVGSVNGHVGDVVLTAADVGAVATADGSVLMNQVTGLATALEGKADVSVTNSLDTRISTIEDDTTYVHTTDGMITDAVLPLDIALVNEFGQVTDKDGTVVTGAGGAVDSVNGQTGFVTLDAADVGAIALGASIAQSQVTDLETDLAAKVDTTDPRLSDVRIPATHAGSHAADGGDPVTLTQAQITGLPTALTGHNNRLSSLETRVTTLEGGAPPGGAGTMVFWEASAPTGDFVQDVTLHSPFGYNPANENANEDGYYMDPAGASSGEVRFVHISENGHLQFREWNETNPPDPVYALDSDLDTLASTVGGKADQSALDTLTTTVGGKASQSDLTALQSTVQGKASQSDLDTLSNTVSGKASQADLTTLSNTVDGKASESDLTIAEGQISTLQTQMTSKADLSAGKVVLSQIPTGIPQASVSGLTTSLAGKADLSGGKVLLAQIPTNIPQASIENLATTFAAKADLVGGKVATSQLPALSTRETYAVANRAAMLALTTAQAQVGDSCIITATADQGTYTLIASDPSQFGNWLLNIGPAQPVTSVNGQLGTVVLSWSDVGALAANAAIPISQVTNLQTTLDGKATVTALTTGLAGKTSPADVQTILTGAAEIKQRADYVSTVSVASLSGQQSVDGVIMPLGSVVLLTAQTSSVTNGLWVVNSGSWARPTDMPTGSYLVRGTLVLIASGTVNANTFWQCTSVSGLVDTNVNNWRKVMEAGPSVMFTNGNGLNLSGTTFSVKPTTGIQVTSAGVGVDTTTVPRKYLTAVPAGSTTCTITHNLNSTSPLVQVIDVASGDGRLIGWTATGLNTVSLEFNTAPLTNQYRCVIIA